MNVRDWQFREISVRYVARYIELRQLGVIGKLWTDNGYELGPVAVNDFSAYYQRQSISLKELETLIDELSVAHNLPPLPREPQRSVPWWESKGRHKTA